MYATCQEAAAALGLFEDESEPMRAMREAVAAYGRPGQLRSLFAYLLLDLPTLQLPFGTLSERLSRPTLR